MGRPRPAAGFAVRQAGWEAPEFNASDLNYSDGLSSKDARRRQKPFTRTADCFGTNLG